MHSRGDMLPWLFFSIAKRNHFNTSRFQQHANIFFHICKHGSKNTYRLLWWQPRSPIYVSHLHGGWPTNLSRCSIVFVVGSKLFVTWVKVERKIIVFPYLLFYALWFNDCRFFLTAMFFFLGKGVLQLQYLMNYYLYSYHLLERWFFEKKNSSCSKENRRPNSLLKRRNRHWPQLAMPPHGSYKNLWHMTSRRCPTPTGGARPGELHAFIYTSPMAACISRLPQWPLSPPSLPSVLHSSCSTKEEEGLHHHTTCSIFRARLTKSAQAIAADQQKARKAPSFVRATLPPAVLLSKSPPAPAPAPVS